MSGRVAKRIRREAKRSRRPANVHERELEHLHRATEFSDDPALRDGVRLLEDWNRHPELFERFERMFTPEARHDANGLPPRRRRGRPRMKGSWPRIYACWTISKDPAMESWWQSSLSSLIWEKAGFETMPAYDTMRRHFVEMERLEEERRARGEKTAHRELADALIAKARRHEPRIGQVIHVDGTAWQTHAALIHDCPDPVRCRSLGGTPKVLTRASDDEVQDQRHDEAKGPAPVEGELPEGALPLAGLDPDFKYIWMSTGHRYRTRDRTSGARQHGPGKSGKHRKKKFWHGGTMVAGVDDFVRAPLAVKNIAADEHEHHAHPALMDEIIEAIGDHPLAMTGDAAQSIKSVFEYNTTHGIASAIPWRQPRADIEREDVRTDRYDEHGVPPCRYCGSPSQMESAGLGFYFDERGNPRLRFRCVHRHTPACEKAQSIACSEEYRLLLPISRLTPFYHALRKSHQSVEGVFSSWRARYQVAGKSPDTRLKRPGVPFQQLRAARRLAIEWFRICLRYGWLGSAPRREYGEIRTTDGTRRLNRLLAARRKRGLNLPRGPAAVKLGLARAGPSP